MTQVHETDVRRPDGSTLHAYTAGPEDGLPVVWHHGTPNIGPPPRPLFAESDRLGLRWVGYDRPGYGGSTQRPDRPIGSAAADVAAVVDALGIDRFAVMGHSGGGPHALACAALLHDRVLAAVSASGPAPYGAPGLDWFAGMADPAALQASVAGRAEREAFDDAEHEGEPGFIAVDEQALEGEWSWFIEVVRPALASGPAPMVDDDLALARPWGFDPATITAPTLFLHGGGDRIIPASHGAWLADLVPRGELLLLPEDGHVSVMRAGEQALAWLAEHARAE
ncbi:MAG: alpha/beta fold hydrolase [Nocardioidaceae bacterium]